jgi:hypothetical protein
MQPLLAPIIRVQTPALQMAFRSLEFVGQAACQKTGVSAPAAGAAARPSEVLTDAHAEYIGILKAHPGLESRWTVLPGWTLALSPLCKCGLDYGSGRAEVRPKKSP